MITVQQMADPSSLCWEYCSDFCCLEKDLLDIPFVSCFMVFHGWL